MTKRVALIVPGDVGPRSLLFGQSLEEPRYVDGGCGQGSDVTVEPGQGKRPAQASCVAGREPGDSELMVRLATDPQAFATLYRRHLDVVVAYAARRCRQPEDVADLVAATFLAALDSASGFDPQQGEVRPWLIGIAHHQWTGRLRKAERERRAVARELGRRALEDSDDYGRLEARIDAADRADEALAALSTLSPSQREVLLLVGWENLTQQQAAQVLGLTPTGLRMRLSRARRALRRAISSDAEQPPPEPADTERAHGALRARQMIVEENLT